MRDIKYLNAKIFLKIIHRYGVQIRVCIPQDKPLALISYEFDFWWNYLHFHEEQSLQVNLISSSRCDFISLKTKSIEHTVFICPTINALPKPDQKLMYRWMGLQTWLFVLQCRVNWLIGQIIYEFSINAKWTCLIYLFSWFFAGNFL